ncbi:MAG: hypothetical protein AABX47_00285 [Nanoarchaeota archaeon]
MAQAIPSLIIMLVIFSSLSSITLAEPQDNGRLAMPKQISGNASKSFNAPGYARLISQDRLKAAQLQYESSQQKASEARKKLATNRAAVKELSEKAAKSCWAWSLSRCARAKSEIDEKARETLSAAASAAIEDLTKAATKADQSDDLTDEEAEQVKSPLNRSAEAITSIRESIENKEGKAPNYFMLAKQLNIEIASSNRQIQISHEKISIAQLTAAISLTKSLGPRLRSVIFSASKEGKNVKAISDMTDQMAGIIETASKKADEAGSALDSGDLETGRAKSKEAKSRLSRSHDLVKEIYKELKSLGLDKELAKTDLLSNPRLNI